MSRFRAHADFVQLPGTDGSSECEYMSTQPLSSACELKPLSTSRRLESPASVPGGQRRYQQICWLSTSRSQGKRRVGVSQATRSRAADGSKLLRVVSRGDELVARTSARLERSSLALRRPRRAKPSTVSSKFAGTSGKG